LNPLGLKISKAAAAAPGTLPDVPEADLAIYRAVEPYTMTSPERIYALIQAVQYLAENEIPGAMVECGVWKGGSMMAAALTLLRLGKRDRDLYLFDTFEGMPQPGARDVAYDGRSAAIDFDRTRTSADSSDWCNAPMQAVREALQSTGYPESRIHLVKGKVEDTIPGAAPAVIALLRLDTDWYESTRHELEHLFPRLSEGGVIIIDDYGHWQGARQATDEYLARTRVRLLLNRIDYTARIGVKA
jgi:O-methyltransferase